MIALLSSLRFTKIIQQKHAIRNVIIRNTFKNETANNYK